MSRSVKMLALLLPIVLGAGAAAWATDQIRGRDGQDQPATQPRFVPGPAEVVGTVAIENEPVVHAQQFGPWTVALAGQPIVTSAPPVFLQPGRAYRVRWAEGPETERYLVHGVYENGWAQAELVSENGQDGARLWINTGRALTIEEVQPARP